MMCLYMGKLNGKKYCLMGMSNKEICDNDKNCRFYVDLEAVKKKGVWREFGFEREKGGESDEVGWGLPPKELASFLETPLTSNTAERPNSFSRCEYCN